MVFRTKQESVELLMDFRTKQESVELLMEFRTKQEDVEFLTFELSGPSLRCCYSPLVNALKASIHPSMKDKK